MKRIQEQNTLENSESNQEKTAFHGRSGSPTNKIESVKRVEMEKPNANSLFRGGADKFIVQ